MVHNLGIKNSVFNKYIGQLRDVNIQRDSMRFRINLERLGQIFAYEISKTLTYEARSVETPLGIASVNYATEQLVVAGILRAGLPMHQGILSVFDDAESAFVSAYRKHHKDGSFEISLSYVSCPKLEETILILADPMMATGASMVKSAEALLDFGKPRQIHFVTAIASVPGLEYVQRYYPDAHIWMGALDEELTAKSYIVPGLGDAGDLAYGEKIQD